MTGLFSALGYFKATTLDKVSFNYISKSMVMLISIFIACLTPLWPCPVINLDDLFLCCLNAWLHWLDKKKSWHWLSFETLNDRFKIVLNIPVQIMCVLTVLLFRPYCCPCPGASCKWQGSLEMVMAHLMQQHKSITTLQGISVFSIKHFLILFTKH